MPNKTIDALVFCPFYTCESKNSITCEGIIGESTVSRFKSEQDKTFHEKNFCTVKHCKGCGVYSSIMQNYIVGARPFAAHPVRH